MNDRPILMTGEMVRATLGGSKTQTRRIVSPKNSYFGSANRSFFEHANFDKAWPERFGGYLHVPCHRGDAGELDRLDKVWAERGKKHNCRDIFPNLSRCEECFRMGWEMTSHRLYPRFEVGDPLWVRETWANVALAGYPPVYLYRADGDDSAVKWKPSIHMPKEASRITLEITAVRVERLQDISEEDAKAEGVDGVIPWSQRFSCLGSEEWPEFPSDDRDRVQVLWESIYGHGSWEKNPWVWATTFKRIKP